MMNSLILNFGSLNVNSFNVSTIGTRNSKSFLKVEGCTKLKQDVLFLCDCRLKNKVNEISKLMGLNRNASYKFYANSDRESRGVAIAIKRNIVHTVDDIYKSPCQNILLLKLTIKGKQLVLGSIYGPNGNDPIFYGNLREKIELWNLPFVIGGDFNTILDTTQGDANLDRIGGGGQYPTHKMLDTSMVGLVRAIALNHLERFTLSNRNFHTSHLG